MDRAATFTELTRRNALRREAKLPLLDLTAEVEWECAAAARRDYEAKCAEDQDVRQRIMAEVIDAFAARVGQRPGHLARMALGGEINRRFDDYMRSINVTPVPHPPSRNPIRYGSHKIA